MTDKCILFAVRNPEAREQPGLAKAIQVARALGASLELFHALTDALIIELGQADDDALTRLRTRVEAEARKPLTRLCKVAEKHGVAANCSVSWDYRPHEAIVRRAIAIRAELVIAECHKGARTRPWFMHLTDWELLRTSPMPVLLIKSGKPYRRPRILAAVDPSHSHAKPLGLDEHIVSRAGEFAKELRGSLHILHAGFPSVVGANVQEAAKRASTSWSMLSVEELEQQEREIFEAFRARTGVPRTRAHFVSGNPATEIPRFAGKLRADIVAMGALSRSGLERIFIGNTAERILGALASDVLVMKPEGLATRIARETAGPDPPGSLN
jgi:universal stress protein E